MKKHPFARALRKLDVIERADNRLSGVAARGLFIQRKTPAAQKVAASKPTPKPTPAPQEVQVKTINQKPAQEPRRWGQSQRSLHDPLTTNATRPEAPAPVTGRPSTTQPGPTMAQSLRNSRDTARLDGHQLAAQRAGLDPNTPGIASMSFEQMKQAAHDANVLATAPLAFKAGMQYRR